MTRYYVHIVRPGTEHKQLFFQDADDILEAIRKTQTEFMELNAETLHPRYILEVGIHATG